MDDKKVFLDKDHKIHSMQSNDNRLLKKVRSHVSFGYTFVTDFLLTNIKMETLRVLDDILNSNEKVFSTEA